VVHARSGPRLNSNRLPRPSSEVAAIQPWWRSTIRRNVGEPDADALELGGGVQALEHAEQPIDVRHVEADAVVAHVVHDLAGALLAADVEHHALAVARVLERVVDQVGPHRPQERRLGPAAAQRLQVELEAIGEPATDQQLVEHRADQRIELDAALARLAPADLREREQAVDQVAPSARWRRGSG